MAKHVFLINDTEDVYHWGCYGTSRAIKDQLLAKGVTEIDCMPVTQTRSLDNVPEKVEDFRDKDHFCSTYPELAKRIDACDAVVINGEGTIHGTGKAPKALLYLAYASKQYFGKKVFLINHSCYPKSSKSSVLDYYKAGYSCCDYVAAREGRSARIIEKKLGIKCVQSFDSLPLTARSVYDQIPPPLIEQPYICLSGAVNYRGAISASIAKQLLKAFPDHKYVYLVGSKNDGINAEEPRVYDSLKQCLPDLQMFDAQSFPEWLSVIKHSELLLSGRFHYAVAALSLGTPTVSFKSNTPKINAITEDLNLPAVIPRSPALLFNAVLWYQLKQIKNRECCNYLDQLCGLAQKNFDWGI